MRNIILDLDVKQRTGHDWTVLAWKYVAILHYSYFQHELKFTAVLDRMFSVLGFIPSSALILDLLDRIINYYPRPVVIKERLCLFCLHRLCLLTLYKMIRLFCSRKHFIILKIIAVVSWNRTRFLPGEIYSLYYILVEYQQFVHMKIYTQERFWFREFDLGIHPTWRN